MNNFAKKAIKTRWLVFALCVIAVFGFFRPAVNVHLTFFGISNSFNFSLATIFEDYAPADILNLDESDLADLLDETEALRGITRRIILSVASYLLAFVLLVAVAISAVADRFKTARIITAAAAFISLIVSGRAILSVPDMVADALINLLGFIARLFNVNNILHITLGWGYWLTLCAAAFVLAATIFPIDKR